MFFLLFGGQRQQGIAQFHQAGKPNGQRDGFVLVVCGDQLVIVKGQREAVRMSVEGLNVGHGQPLYAITSAVRLTGFFPTTTGS